METFAISEKWDRVQPKLRSTERDCPHCDGVLEQNEKEECYECILCGYIDCSNANEVLPLAKVV